jgi:4-hydroxy-3-methylbut-2-enyl diphosphate reductase
MNVILADTAGFCMGVDLALRKLNKAIQENPDRPIFTLGPIIHNPQVLAEYERQGVRRAETPEDLPSGSIAVIRAHGIPLSVETELAERGVEIIDATCPKVKKAQLLIAKQAEQGRRLLLYGEDDHPEVRGLRSYARNRAVVFGSVEELDLDDLTKGAPSFLAAQTTQDRQAFERIEDLLKERLGPDLPVLHTVCDATRERQAEALALACQVDAMVVVGGYQSGNTRRLVHVARGQGIPCHHVETADDLDLDVLWPHATIGLTAGASTPKNIIESVREALERL